MPSRNANNRKRGTSYELVVAKTLGGVKVGQLNLPWDVEMPGYARLQVKKLAEWPSMNAIVGMIDSIPPGLMRGVVVCNAPGRGHASRAFIILPLDEFADRHGR